MADQALEDLLMRSSGKGLSNQPLAGRDFASEERNQVKQWTILGMDERLTKGEGFPMLLNCLVAREDPGPSSAVSVTTGPL